MNKKELSDALTERGIPHDPEAKNDLLEETLKFVTQRDEAAAVTLADLQEEREDLVADVGDLKKQIEQLTEQLDKSDKALAAAHADPSHLEAMDEPEDTSDRNEMIRAKVDAGLTPEQAASVVDAQIANDLAAE